MSLEQQQLFALPVNADARSERHVLVDVVVLDNVRAFLSELRRLTDRMELVVDRLADTITAQGGPGGGDRAMRSFVIRLAADEARRTGQHPGLLDIRQLVKRELYDMQAHLEACLDPVVGGGVLSRRAAGLLLAMVAPAAAAARAGRGTPLSWRGLPIIEADLYRLGEPLLGVSFAGCAPFRLVRGGDLAFERLPVGPRSIWNLLELARVTSFSGDHGLVVIPHLDDFDELDAVA